MSVSRLLPIPAIAWCLALLATPQGPSQQAIPAYPDTESALKATSEKFCAALARKDLNALVDLWSQASPGLPDFKQQVQQLFSVYDRIEIKNITIGKVILRQDGATARLRFEMQANEVRTGKPATALGLQIEALSFVKEGAVFRISGYGPAAAELAASLIGAKSDQERGVILEADQELVTIELRRQLISLGNRLKVKGDYGGAILSYQIAQSIAGQIGDKEGVAWSLADIGVIYTAKADYTVAIDYLEKSLKLQRDIGNQLGVLFSLKNLGDAHRFLDHQKEALEIYKECLTLADAAGNKLIKAYVIGAISGLYAQRGEFNQALEFAQESLTLHESVGDKAGIAAALGSLGYINGAAGNPDRAQDLLERSLALSESIGDKADMAYALINLGARYFAQGDYTRALEYYERSLAINESVGNKSGIATGLNNIGIIYRIQGNYAQALEYLEQSLKIHQDIGAPLGVARVLNSIGNVHRMQLDYGGARDYYNKSLRLYEQQGDSAGIVTELDNIGGALAAQRDYAEALKYLMRSLELADAKGLSAGLARSLGHAAFVYSAQANYSAAIQAADRGTLLGLQVGQAETAMDTRVAAGNAYLGLHQFDQARKAFDQAITIIEDIRSRVAGPEQEVQRFFEGYLYPYQAMVGLLITEGDISGALSYAERGKGRVLLDVLSSGKANISKAMTTEDQEREQRLAAELVSLNNQIYAEQQRTQPDTGRIADLNERIRKARLEHEDFQTTLYALHPELKIKRGEAEPVNLDEAAHLVSDGRTAVLEYVVTSDKTYVFALTRSREPSSHTINLTVHSIDSGEASLTRQVEQFRQTLANQNYGFQKPAVELWRLLLGPVQAQLAGQSSVVIVPDGILWSLPFQALQSAEGRFLVEDFAVSYAPSLTVLSQMQPIRKRSAAYSGELLAVGNPLQKNWAPAGASSPLVDKRFDPLPEAETQAKALGELYGPQHSKVLLGPDAREDVIKAEASRYKVLQFATHGVFNDASPLYSYILLSKAKDSATEDGLLEAWEIMNLNLNADLVVLSACETARGRVGAGEGVIGLSWALFVAGCPSSVVSQWKVESASTTELMLEFHRNLSEGPGRLSGRLSKAEALRRAQLSLLHSKKYSHPFYWAAFVLMGDGSRPISQ